LRKRAAVRKDRPFIAPASSVSETIPVHSFRFAYNIQAWNTSANRGERAKDSDTVWQDKLKLDAL